MYPTDIQLSVGDWIINSINNQADAQVTSFSTVVNTVGGNPETSYTITTANGTFTVSATYLVKSHTLNNGVDYWVVSKN